MQQPQHSQKSESSSPPSLMTSSAADQPEPLEITVRFGESDKDVLGVYMFLLATAGESLLGAVDEEKALTEIARVQRDGASLLAFVDGKLAGVMGLMKVEWWYGDDSFITNRWFFILPDLKFKGVGARLLAEARVISTEADLKLVIIGHKRARSNGIHFARVRTYHPSPPLN